MPLSADRAPVRIGVAGLGRAGTYHLERLGLREDCRVVAAYDDCATALARADAVARRLHSTWSDFLADGHVELVLLAAPPALHAELAIGALAAGKHVVIETPLCLNLAEADAIAAAARRTGGLACVAQTRRWSDDFRTAQAALASGELGEPRSLKYVNWQYNPQLRPPAEGAALLNGGPGTAVPDWRRHSSTGGGLLWEFGVHYFDQLLQLAGRPAESVFARLTPSAACDCDDGFLAIVSFSGGLTAHVEASRVAAAPLSTGWMIDGDRRSYAGFTQYSPNRDGEVVDLPLMPVPAPADEFYRNVVNHLRNGDPSPVPLDQARQVISLIEAVRRSAQTRQVASVEP
jgi:scyllo-inositol 2-dehydrogenase (NADP+)